MVDGQSLRCLQQQLLIGAVRRQVVERVDRRLRRVEGRDLRLAERLTCGVDLDASHPRGHDGLRVVVGGGNHRFGNVERTGHRLWCENDEHAVDFGILEADVDGLLVTLRWGISDDVHGVSV